MTTQEYNASMQPEQTADIEAAWTDARMLRNFNADGSISAIVIAKSKVVADFNAWIDGNGDEQRANVAALYSRVGERATEREFVKAGWRKAKDVHYNSLTGELVLAAPKERKPKTDSE